MNRKQLISVLAEYVEQVAGDLYSATDAQLFTMASIAEWLVDYLPSEGVASSESLE